MKKTNFLWIVLDLIFLIIFNAIFFIAGGVDHKISVWISYGFIHFSYFMLLITPKLIREGKSADVFGFSLYSISSIYFIIELIVGVIFIFISLDSYKPALLVQLSIAGLYGIMLIPNMIANEHTADSEQKRQYQIEYVKNGSAKLKLLLERINDKEIKKRVEKIYDTLYSSPVKSNPNLEQIEKWILQSIEELEDAISSGNKNTINSLSNRLLSSINERNSKLRSY